MLHAQDLEAERQRLAAHQAALVGRLEAAAGSATHAAGAASPGGHSSVGGPGWSRPLEPQLDAPGAIGLNEALTQCSVLAAAEQRDVEAHLAALQLQVLYDCYQIVALKIASYLHSCRYYSKGEQLVHWSFLSSHSHTLR